jgi:hypothetical protein
VPDHILQLLHAPQAEREQEGPHLAAGDCPAREDAAVTGQQEAILLVGLLDEVAVLDIGRPGGVAADRPEPAGEPSAHGVAGKTNVVGTMHPGTRRILDQDRLVSASGPLGPVIRTPA